MTGRKPGWYWKICWGFIIPVGLLAILVYTLATQEELTHDGASYPIIALGLPSVHLKISLSQLKCMK